MDDMPGGSRSQLYRLVDERLAARTSGDTLAQLVERRRPHASWRAIAAEVHQVTGVAVSWETLRTWFADRIQVEVTVR